MNFHSFGTRVVIGREKKKEVGGLLSFVTCLIAVTSRHYCRRSVKRGFVSMNSTGSEEPHSTLSKNLIKNWIPLTGPLLGGRALLGGPEYGLVEILQNGACQKKIKNHFIPQFFELSKNSLYSYPQFSELSRNSLNSCAEFCTMVAKSLEKKSGHKN